jgi:hypothetical protein
MIWKTFCNSLMYYLGFYYAICCGAAVVVAQVDGGGQVVAHGPLRGTKQSGSQLGGQHFLGLHPFLQQLLDLEGVDQLDCFQSDLQGLQHLDLDHLDFLHTGNLPHISIIEFSVSPQQGEGIYIYYS